MQVGAKAESGYNLALTKVLTDGRHVFLLEVGTPAGEEVLAEIPHQQALPEDLARAKSVLAPTAASMARNGGERRQGSAAAPSAASALGRRGRTLSHQ